MSVDPAVVASEPPENFVKDGIYRILNVYSQNYVGFNDKRDGLPVIARTNGLQDDALILVRVALYLAFPSEHLQRY
jgi:hypothetical protein